MVAPDCGEDIPTSFFIPSPLGSQETFEYMKTYKAEGLTGPIQFGSNGQRLNYFLRLMELKKDSTLKIAATLRNDGEWVEGGMAGGSAKKKATQIVLNVTTIDSPPFLFVRNQSKVSTRSPDEGPSHVLNSDEFEGFCVDLAEEIGRLLNIKFYFRHVKDGQYGAPDPITKEWNGMIGELIRGDADAAIAPLTSSLFKIFFKPKLMLFLFFLVTSTRERVVQMTKPILNTGISIMIKKPEKQQPGVFSFLEPLSSAIWVCTLFAYCGTAVCMWILCRLNNGEMVTPFRNSFWSALCALLGLGGEFSPKSFSGRLLATVWYFFCLILISSYTANMTAFLTIERLEVPIESAEDLVRQDRIQYGTLNSGSTKGFFMTSVNPLYQKMWEVMNATQPSVFVANTKEGVERVRNSAGRYAFFLESVMNAFYNQRRPCNTMQVGPLLDSKGYGIVTPLGSTYAADLNYAVLYLKEIGVVQQLVTKWWYDKGECPQDNSKQSDVSGALKLNNITGVFFILIGGLVLGIIISTIEFIVAAAGLSRKTKVGLPVAARELLSGCILGSANKTIRPLHSLDLLARVLPWVEMPNLSATMLLSRLDAISPRDPRRKYVAAACLKKYSTPEQDTKDDSKALVLAPRTVPNEDAIMSPEHRTASIIRRPVDFPHHVNFKSPEKVFRSPPSESSVTPQTDDYEGESKCQLTRRIVSSRRRDDMSETASITTEDTAHEMVLTNRPSGTGPVCKLTPEQLRLRPRVGVEKGKQLVGSVSLYEMLTKGGEKSAGSTKETEVIVSKVHQALNIDSEESLEQYRWYKYEKQDFSNL